MSDRRKKSVSYLGLSKLIEDQLDISRRLTEAIELPSYLKDSLAIADKLRLSIIPEGYGRFIEQVRFPLDDDLLSSIRSSILDIDVDGLVVAHSETEVPADWQGDEPLALVRSIESRVADAEDKSNVSGRLLTDQSKELWEAARQRIPGLDTTAELDAAERNYLGREAGFGSITKNLRWVDENQRPQTGQAVNIYLALTRDLITERRPLLQLAETEVRLASDGIDMTLPGRAPRIGTVHPISAMIDEVSDILAHLGFETVFGTEIETERYNFDLLNIPTDHPARDVWDTIFVEPMDAHLVLRTHTSPMQARVMERRTPPIRVIVPGRTYRFEAQDASHEWMFHQIEGLAIDDRITLTDLKGVLQELARQLFGAERKIRFRCDFFPFVEPGVDFAVDCAVCGGMGCRVCKQTGWLEMGGAGMVHPAVLEGVGVDPDAYQGFAFGLGVERLVMMRYGITDIRAFAGNDLRFLGRFARSMV